MTSTHLSSVNDAYLGGSLTIRITAIRESVFHFPFLLPDPRRVGPSSKATGGELRQTSPLRESAPRAPNLSFRKHRLPYSGNTLKLELVSTRPRYGTNDCPFLRRAVTRVIFLTCALD